MAQFNIGDYVRNIETNKKGKIDYIYPPRRGRQYYKVFYENEPIDESEVNLEYAEVIADAFDRCIHGIYGSYMDFTKINTSFKIRHSNNSTLSSIKASKTIFKAYQYIPLLKFVNSDIRRLLIADEVGLGKTIEAGHIMMELKARGELKNVLIVCPLSLQHKWQEELENRFGLIFRIYDPIADLIADLKAHNGMVQGIVSYDKLRVAKDGHHVNEDKDILEFIESKNRQFSLVVCDEAHRLRNHDTMRYKGMVTVLNHADAVLFLTATPIMISEENLFNLLRLLNGQRYDEYEQFQNEINRNKPFIQSLRMLNTNQSLSSIYDFLKGAKVKEYVKINDKIFPEKEYLLDDLVKDMPIYKRILERLQGPDTLESRAKIQFDLSAMSPMNTIFSRTRKVDVITDMSQAKRKPQSFSVKLYEEERKLYYQTISNYSDANALELIQRKRQIASSIYAFSNPRTSLEKGEDRYADYPDGKFDALLEIIDEVNTGDIKKLIVFTLFKNTLLYLQIRLKSKNIGCVAISGDTKMEERVEAVEQFKNDDSIQVLLSTEVGSEGLDMQFCNAMVNYDLPWNPMVVEQRIGRIDRFGQQSAVVNIYTLIVEHSIQEVIYERLINRIKIFENTIGDLEAILDAEFVPGKSLTIKEAIDNLEKEIYSTELTEEEKEEKIKAIESAIIKEQQQVEKLSSDLSNTFTNDSYFRDQINRILNNNAYVTEIELKNYVEKAIAEKLTTCTFLNHNNNIYEIRLPQSNLKVIINFLIEYQQGGIEYEELFSMFINSIREKSSLLVTFNQEVAYANPRLIYLNMYHPFILACLNYFKSTINLKECTFRFKLAQNMIGEKIAQGVYFVAIYKVTTSRKIWKKLNESQMLYPVLYDIQNECVIDDVSIVDAVMGRIQTDGQFMSSSDLVSVPKDKIAMMRLDMVDAIDKYEKNHKKEIMDQLENDIISQRLSMEVYHNSRIQNMRNIIDTEEADLRYLKQNRGYDSQVEIEIRNKERVLPLHRRNLQNQIERMEEDLARLQEIPTLTISHELLMLNLINIK